MAAAYVNPNPMPRQGLTSAPNRVAGTFVGKPVTPQVGSGSTAFDTASRLQGMNPNQKAAFQRYIAARTPTPAGGAVGTQPVAGQVAPTALSGAQESGYMGQRQTVNEDYLNKMNGSTLQIGQAYHTFAHQLRDLTTNQGLQRTAEPGSFQARGILGSGIDHAALQQLDQNQFRARTDLSGMRSGALSTLYDARNGIENSRNTALANIREARHQALLNLAVRSIR